MLKLLGAPRAVAGLSFETTLDEISLHQFGCGDYYLHLVERGDKRRSEMEQYIADAYARVFGAALTRFYPSLVALHDREHRVLGAAGARSAAEGLECFQNSFRNLSYGKHKRRSAHS